MGLPGDRRIGDAERHRDGAKQKIGEKPEEKKTDRAAIGQNFPQRQRRLAISHALVRACREAERFAKRRPRLKHETHRSRHDTGHGRRGTHDRLQIHHVGDVVRRRSGNCRGRAKKQKA